MIPFYTEHKSFISAGDEFYIAMGVKPPTDTTISELQVWVRNLRKTFQHNKIISSTSGLLNLDSLGEMISRNAYLDSNIYCLSYDYEPGFEPEFSWDLDSTLMALDSAREIAHEHGKQLMTAIIARSLLADWNPPGTDYNPTGELWNYDSIKAHVDILEVQTQGFAHYGLTHNEGLSLYGEALDTLVAELHGTAFAPQLTFGTTSNGISAQNVYDALNETYKKGIDQVVLWQVAGAQEYMQEFFYLTGIRAPTLQEEIFPKYEGTYEPGQRVGSVFRISLVALAPSTPYDMKAGASWDSGTCSGDYCIFDGDDGTAIQPNVTPTGTYTISAFVTDQAGDKNLWVVLYPDSNSEFNPGDPAYLSVTVRPTGTDSSTELTSTDVIQFLDLSGVEATDTSGAMLVGSASSAGNVQSKFIFAWDNTTGTGRPLGGYVGEENGILERSYPAGYDTAVGFYGFVIPRNDPNGVERIEAFDGNGQGFVSSQATGGFSGTVNPPGPLVKITSSEAPLDSVAAGIQEVSVSNSIKFQLTQNYPNPFNPTTNLEFSVGGRTYAKLFVYNSIGERVAELFEGDVEPETIYRVMFNGAQLPSGVYFVRLQTSEGSIMRKVMLLK